VHNTTPGDISQCYGGKEGGRNCEREKKKGGRCGENRIRKDKINAKGEKQRAKVHEE
jgi:hypothetical protein